jgi:hypothetical protein
MENIFMVFLSSPCRETAKNAIKLFDMDFPQKVFVVFLNSPCLETHKNSIKKKKKKAPTYPIKWLSARYTSLSIKIS